MKLTLQLRFHTQPGQSLFVTGDHPALGRGVPEKAVPLRYLDDECWTVTLDFPAGSLPGTGLGYRYILREADGSLTEDWGAGRAIHPGMWRRKEALVRDAWNHAGYPENAFYTEPFAQVLLRANRCPLEISPVPSATHVFRVKAPLLTRTQTVCLLGSSPELGQWSTANPVLMSRREGEAYFAVELDLGGAGESLAYKYGVYDMERRRFVRFEEGDNRAFNQRLGSDTVAWINDGFVRLPFAGWKGAGVALPVFSLRSESGFGVGEFADLKGLADWCQRVGLKLIQILPVNDTTSTHTWRDSYPYSAISVFALHPIYLHLGDVIGAGRKPLPERWESERKRLNAMETLDYEAVMRAKLAFLREVYPRQRDETFAGKAYREFFRQNEHWLVAYAVFCHWRDRYGTAEFDRWPDHRRYEAGAARALAAEDSPDYDEIAFHYFVQYHLHLQLREATDYAHARGVILKGDIAIGISRHGVDAWQQPEAFHLDVQAGAPPDDFAVKGQNWGFPTYNWDLMKQDGFAWWKRRFEQMARYFDAFRIDHILGFFRIWSIPVHAVEGIMGYFVPALPVRAGEFTGKGIRFDRDRYATPFITDAILQEVFGEESETVRRQFLEPEESGRWKLKRAFATQRQVEQHFAGKKDSEANRRLKEGLYDLISNVILFEAPGAHGKDYHFRFGMEGIPSFKHLDAGTQAALKELYVDYFFRRQEGLWAREAMQKLPALRRVTRMLICGEDLGLVPACVPGVMRQLGLLSLEVQRMPKELSREFSRPAEAPYLSVVTPSTHDMSTIRGWWEEDRQRAQRFFSQELEQPGAAPYYCEPWVNEAVVKQHLNSPAMWSVFQWQDLAGMDGALRRRNPQAERINVPADPRHYWRYRMHMTLESLQQAHDFNRQLQACLQLSRR